MNLFLLAIGLIAYLLFGFMIFFIRNRLEKTKNMELIILLPIALSFLLGFGILFYSINLI